MSNKSQPSFQVAFALFLAIVGIIAVGSAVLGTSIHVLLIVALTLTCYLSSQLGYSLEELIECMARTIGQSMSALLVFILIGCIIGAWIHSGTVPALIFYGLEFLPPKYFLPAGLVICSIASVVTGTSWGTIGTVGLALLGVGIGLGIPPGLVAGMIISGAFFGDKMSPISDTTNLAALTAKTTIYSHIGSMLFTTIPAYIVTLVLFTLVGLGYSGAENVDAAEVALIQEVLATEFDLNPMVLAPMVALLTMMIVRVHTLPAMLTGVVVATIVSLVFQDSSLASALTAINEGYTNKTGVEVVDALIVRGGIQSMMYTFSLTFIALSLGGVLDQVGYLRVVVEKTIEKIKSAASMITFVLFSTAFSNAATGDTYISIILNGSLYGDTFDRTGLDRSTLSRLLEEGGTMTGALIPWTSTGAFITGTLGVSTLSYLPYCFLNIINPMLSIALAYIGIITFRDVSRIVAAKRADAL